MKIDNQIKKFYFPIDVDECSYDKEACDINQVCFNEIGGYRCDCKVGFQLDPLTNACEGRFIIINITTFD
jgi:hypothetical protein